MNSKKKLKKGFLFTTISALSIVGSSAFSLHYVVKKFTKQNQGAKLLGQQSAQSALAGTHFSGDISKDLQILKDIKKWRENKVIVTLDNLLKRRYVKIQAANGSVYEKTIWDSPESRKKNIRFFNFPLIKVDDVTYQRVEIKNLVSMSYEERNAAKGHYLISFTRNASPIKYGATLTLPDNSKLTWKAAANGGIGWTNNNGDLVRSSNLFRGLWHHSSPNYITVKKYNSNHYFAAGALDPLYVDTSNWNQVTLETHLYRKSRNLQDKNNFVTLYQNQQNLLWKKNGIYITEQEALTALGNRFQTEYWNIVNKNTGNMVNYNWKSVAESIKNDVLHNRDVNVDSASIKRQLVQEMQQKENVILNFNTNLFNDKVKLRRILIGMKEWIDFFNKYYNKLVGDQIVNVTSYTNLLKKYKEILGIINFDFNKMKQVNLKFLGNWNKVIGDQLVQKISDFNYLFPQEATNVYKNLQSVLKNKRYNESLTKLIDSQHSLIKSLMENKIANFKRKVVSQNMENLSLKVPGSKVFKSFSNNSDHFGKSLLKTLIYPNYVTSADTYSFVYSKTQASETMTPVNKGTIESWNQANPGKDYWYTHRNSLFYKQMAAATFSNTALNYFTNRFALGDIRNSPDNNPLLAKIYDNIHFTNMGQDRGYTLTYNKDISPNVSLLLMPQTNKTGTQSFLKTTGYVPFLDDYAGWGRPVNSFARFVVIAKNGYKFEGGVDVNVGEVNENNKPVKSSALFIVKAVTNDSVNKLSSNIVNKNNVQLDLLEQSILGYKLTGDEKQNILNSYELESTKLYKLWDLYHKFENHLNTYVNNRNSSNDEKMEIFKGYFSQRFTDGVKPELFISKDNNTFFRLSIVDDNGETIYKYVFLSKSIKASINSNSSWTNNYLPTASVKNDLQQYPWFPKALPHLETSGNLTYITDIETQLQNSAGPKHQWFWDLIFADWKAWEAVYKREKAKAEQESHNHHESPWSAIKHMVNGITTGDPYSDHGGSPNLLQTIITSLPVFNESLILLNLVHSIGSISENGFNAENVLELGTSGAMTLAMFGAPIAAKAPSFFRPVTSKIPTSLTRRIPNIESESILSIKNQISSHADLKRDIKLETIFPWEKNEANAYNNFIKGQEQFLTLSQAKGLYNFFDAEINFDIEAKNWVMVKEDVSKEATTILDTLDIDYEEQGATGTSATTSNHISNWEFKENKWIEKEAKKEIAENSNLAKIWVDQGKTSTSQSQLQPNSQIKLGLLGGGQSSGKQAQVVTPLLQEAEFNSQMKEAGGHPITDMNGDKMFRMDKDTLAHDGWISDEVYTNTGRMVQNVMLHPDTLGRMSELELSDRSLFFLEHSKPGNCFAGIADLSTGQIEIHPVVTRGASSYSSAGTQPAKYTGPYPPNAFDNKPILHLATHLDSSVDFSTKLADATPVKTSHAQLAVAMHPDLNVSSPNFRQNNLIAFSFRDTGAPDAMLTNKNRIMSSIGLGSNSINRFQNEFWLSLRKNAVDNTQSAFLKYDNYQKVDTLNNTIVHSSFNVMGPGVPGVNGYLPRKVATLLIDRIAQQISERIQNSAQSQRLFSQLASRNGDAFSVENPVSHS